MTVVDPTMLHLEIEAPPSGLVNLVQNPNGDGGAWGWVTPVPGATLNTVNVSGDNALQYVNAPGVASYIYTEPLAVTAGNYVAAYWNVVGGTAGYYRARFEFLDSTQTVLSSGGQSTQTGYQQIVGATMPAPLSYAATLIPTGTVYTRLRFDLYANTSGANPSGASTFDFNNVTVATANTSAALSPIIRTNQCTNPSFETNTTNWAGVGDTSLARITTDHEVGTACASASSAGSAAGIAYPASGALYFPGRSVYVSAYVKVGTGTGSRVVRLGVGRTGNPAGTPSAPGDVVAFSVSAATWTQISATFFLPPDLGAGRFFIETDSLVVLVDAVLIEVISSTEAAGQAYFDGATATAGSISYAWTGTANASTSTAKSSTLTYIPPVAYLDVLMPTNAISIDRPEFDVGTLTATIVSAALDPAVSDLIATGRRCRVRHDALADPLFSGRIQQATVAYDLTVPDATRRATVTVTASDNMTNLAKASRSQGVGTIAELPFVLEGAGVPWNVNGSGNQVATASVQSFNDQASAADQIVITRDSVMGYAWIDTNNVLQAWDRSEISTSVVASLDESDYNDDISIDYDSERLIDSVVIELMTYDEANGAASQENLGPFIAAGTTGQHGQTFTVNGLTDAQCASLAADILTANSTPVRIVESLTITITAENVSDFAWLDHYDLVHISNTRGGISSNHRVIGVNHAITAVKRNGTVETEWILTLNFAEDGTVAPPQELPDPSVVQLKGQPSSVAYTPAWTASTTNPSLNNGSIVGGYHLSDGWCDFFIRLTIGSMTTFGSGAWRFSLPVDPADEWWLFASCLALDTSAGNYYDLHAAMTSDTGSVVTLRTSSGATAQLLAVTGTVPFTWAAGDVATISGRYPVG